MGVRYLAVPERPNPGIERTDPAPAQLLVALVDQLDLVRLEGPPGLELDQNSAWIPSAAALSTCDVASGTTDSLGPPIGTTRARPIHEGERVPAGAILWGQTYDRVWSASLNGSSLPHRRVLGFANGYTLNRAAPSRSPTTISGCGIPRS